MTTINVGVTAAPIPLAAQPTPVDLAALLTDEDRMLPLLQAVSGKTLDNLIGWCSQEHIRRTQTQLLASLRALVDPEKVARIEFVTYDPDTGSGPHWEEETFYLHHKDGGVTPMEFPDEEDAGYEEFKDACGRVVDHLEDYSRLAPPRDGARLTVNLASGEFDVSGGNPRT
ncbi:hypothetical protein ACH41H_44690 [Streptomyces sp. NPDC020800]|uniref:hypothetical protein n=1 Tax=Streptomyces sp. NPDC020800 TaxID=3365092 RepID=UPI00378ECB60